MNLLNTEKLSKSFGEKVLFKDISFGIDEGDKIGIIGVNGTGKSTLLKIIAGIESQDSGIITTVKGLKIGYLPQMPEFEKNMTVINQVFNNPNPILNIIKEYENTVNELKNNNSEQLNNKIMELSLKIDKYDAWQLENDAKSILTKLDISDFNKNVDLLSGGQRKRVAMAGALISPVDLLILDEPTNHIDNETIEWLERYLEKYTKSLIMVTHDRYFLDRVVNKTFEIHNTNLYTYYGNYSQFLNLKAERQQLVISNERKHNNLLRRELEWVKRGAKARSTKQKARLERFEELSNTKFEHINNDIDINVGYSRLGKKTIEINNISKSYNGIKYIDDFSYIILKNDRIGIIGKNGCGKSTLLNIITGKLKPDTGYVEYGETVKIGIFSQENDINDGEKRVIDYIKETAEYIETSDGKISASQMLEKFLFSDNMQWSFISKLSGGEKRRLYLLKVLMSAPNILFFDEPTNDLDIETLTILEDYIDNFNGAVVIVSHDRYFLDKCCERIFSFEENGKIQQFEGGYTDYTEKKEFEKREVLLNETKKEKNTSWKKENSKLKMTYKEQKEFETIDEVISNLENNINEIDSEIESIKSDYVKLQELTEKKEELELKLKDTMDRWVYLNELNDKIENSK